MSDEADATKEVGKAAQEIAKTSSKAIDVARDLGGWLNRIFGRAIEDTVGVYWTDRIAVRRVEAAIFDWAKLELLLQRTQQRLKAKGVSVTRSVPPKVALPLLEFATIENEEELHLLWANLLAAALDPAEDEIHRQFVSTLAEMTSKDAAVLQQMHLDSLEPISSQRHYIPSLTYGPGFDGTHKHSEMSVVTLYKLGLIKPAYLEFDTFEPPEEGHRGSYGPYREKVQVPGDLGSVTFTEFGLAFCKAVIVTHSEADIARYPSQSTAGAR